MSSSFDPSLGLGSIRRFFNSDRAANIHPMPPTDDIGCVHEYQAMQLTVPRNPLGVGSLQIGSTKTDGHASEPNPSTRRGVLVRIQPPVSDFTDWAAFRHIAAFELMQYVIRHWQQQGISDYFVFGKATAESRFNWEVVPYSPSLFNRWKQYKVLWTISFGGSTLPDVERERLAANFRKEGTSLEDSLKQETGVVDTLARSTDVFCQQTVIGKQQLFEGTAVRVLYNDAPIAIEKGKLHFLITTVRHCAKLLDLSKEEYTEAMQISQKLIRFYRRRGFTTAYLSHSNGTAAGQTVPHWYQHVVFTGSKLNDLGGKLKVLLKMSFRAPILPTEELTRRVTELRTDLAVALRE